MFAVQFSRINISKRLLSGNAIQDDPLILLRNKAITKNLCDESGGHLPEKFWTFSMATLPIDLKKKVPNLKTVSLNRLTEKGIDFISKKGSLTKGQPTSILQTFGSYKVGETVEQWRAEGLCEALDLDEILPYVTPNTVVEMIATHRALSEFPTATSTSANEASRRNLVVDHPHFEEIVQTTRYEFETGIIGKEEMSENIEAWRFVPTRMERMVGSPDKIMWDRWEWLRDSETGSWHSPNNLLPY